MIKMSLQNTWAHKRRLIGTFLAVLIGVGFLSGTLVLGDTLRANFTKLFDAGYAGTDVVVRPHKPDDGGSDDGSLQASRTLQASLVDKIAKVDGVRAAVAEVQTLGMILGKDGTGIGGDGPPTFAASWNPDRGINPYHIVIGRVPSGPDEVVIDSGSAKSGKLRVGDSTAVLVPNRVPVKIVGIAEFGDTSAPGGVTWAFFSPSGTAAHLTRVPGTANQISVAAKPGISQSELLRRIEPVIGSGNEAITGKAIAKEAVDDLNKAFLSFLTGFLVAFAGIAVFVGTFSIYNTFSIIVAQRGRELALMRAIGATRGQVMGATMVEALVIGFVASVVGFVAGLGVATGLKGVFDAFGLNLPAGGLTIKASSIIVGLIVGVVVTFAAALVPAWRASRVAPIEALRATAVESAVPKRLRSIIGVIVFLGGVITLSVSMSITADSQITVAGIGAAVTLLGMLVLGPVIARPVAGLIGLPLAKLGGVTGELSRENAVRNPRRTASTAAALLVGVAVVVLFTVFIASAKNLVTQSVDKTFGGDLVIRSGSFGGVLLPPTVATDAAKIDGVERAVGLGYEPVGVNGENPDYYANADVVPLTKLVDLGITSGTPSAIDAGGIAVNLEQAKKDKVSVGDTLKVVFPDATTQTLRVGMIYRNADIVGSYLLSREGFAAHSSIVADRIVFVQLQDGASLPAVRKQLQVLTKDIGKPKILDRAGYTKSVGEQLDLLLGLIVVMLALAILIAVMGIANTLALSVHERTRELGILRAVGTTRRQVRRLVRWEAVIVSTFGTVGGVGLGVGLGAVLVRAAFSDSSSNPFTVPVPNIILVLVLGIIVGVLAAWRPASRAARLEILAAVSE